MDWFLSDRDLRHERVKHSKFERMHDCNCSFIIEKGSIIEWIAATGIADYSITLKKGMTASVYSKQNR